MLQIQQLGALPPGMTAKDEGPVKLAPPARFADGPQLVVGPFSFPANHPGPLTVHVPLAKMRAREDIAAFGNWAFNNVREMSEGKYGFCTVKYDGVRWGKPPTGACPLMFPQYMMRSRGRGYLGVSVPDGEAWDTLYITGKSPIAKFTHPVLGEDWGVFLTIIEGMIVFTFKKRPRGYFDAIWAALRTVPVNFAELVSDLISIIGSAFCAIAQSYMGDLEKLANRDPNALKPENLTATNAKFAKLGISASTLDEVWKGSMTGMAVQALANAVGEKICGTPAPKTQPVYPTGSIKTRVGANWRIAIPVGTTVGMQLGQAQLGQTHTEVQPVATDVDAIEVDAKAFDTAVARPWYKKWYVWLGIGVAAAGATTATVMIVKD